jgi:hypothetical protein
MYIPEESANRGSNDRQQWGKSAGSGLVRRPSGLPSIADIALRCRE